jgi:hypothetical protein
MAILGLFQAYHVVPLQANDVVLFQAFYAVRVQAFSDKIMKNNGLAGDERSPPNCHIVDCKVPLA